MGSLSFEEHLGKGDQSSGTDSELNLPPAPSHSCKAPKKSTTLVSTDGSGEARKKGDARAKRGSEMNDNNVSLIGGSKRAILIHHQI
jgi:hypothetical protein